MVEAVALYKTAVSVVRTGGEAVTPMFGPVAGGFIVNPPTAKGQGIAQAEVLWVDVTRDATLGTESTSIPLQPGQRYTVTPGQLTNVSVNAATSGHRFSGVVLQPPTPYPPAPQPGDFPPAGPTTLTKIIPSYLYQEYADDQDLQAFVAAYNGIAQEYATWFATILLPVWTSPTVSGGLLDWVAKSLYGMVRTALSSGRNRDIGPLNTWAYNTIGYNVRRRVGPQNVTVTTDDVFKRIMTWNLYRGDGTVLNVRWLKRRVARFLIGTNGSAPNIGETYDISVTFGADQIISIRITVGTRSILSGALYNRMGWNAIPLNSVVTRFNPAPTPLPFAAVLKEAIESGVLQLPFQFTVKVTI